MIGIGVAIDYSLFILARYREEREAGRGPDEARSEALATSGLAVSFSGLAVIVSLAGLWMVDNQALRSMALGAMVVVAVSILTAIDPAAGADRDARRSGHAGRRRRPGRCASSSAASSAGAGESSTAGAPTAGTAGRASSLLGEAGRRGSWPGPGPRSFAVSARSS